MTLDVSSTPSVDSDGDSLGELVGDEIGGNILAVRLGDPDNGGVFDLNEFVKVTRLWVRMVANFPITDSRMVSSKLGI